MKYSIYILILISVAMSAMPVEARKTGYRLAVKETKEEKEEAMTAGSFMVASQCDDCNSGYNIGQIRFSGFDKAQSSNQESFFITNLTDRTMTAISLYIEYLTPDGRQLHKKFFRLACNIPPGETRKADIKSWDTQNSFYFLKSRPGRNAGTPFDVRFDPVAFYLRY